MGYLSTAILYQRTNDNVLYNTMRTDAKYIRVYGVFGSQNKNLVTGTGPGSLGSRTEIS